ncbi:MAG: nitroreductase [Nitrospiraceae bacterium]|nr:nitroreductase [Nitrospiraceae bacterium]MSR24023.1 nitroreductase [Nitrospiraceae bacterium]
MEKPADTQHPIHDLLARRWSPRAFADRLVAPDVLRSLWEAARWAPSSANQQPWSFLVATRDDQQEFGRMLGCLVEGNQIWAKQAPVLMVSIAGKLDRDNDPNAHAWYDVGQAVISLSVQATALGLFVHQMAGILPDKIRELYQIPDSHEPVTGLALGYPGTPEQLTDKLRQREIAARTRKPIGKFVFAGRWGQKSKLV